MALFGKSVAKLFGKATSPVARLFGAKPTADQPEARAAQDGRTAQVARERERRAAREAAEVRQQIEQLTERGRRIAGQRAAVQESERIRQQVMQLAQRERMARLEQQRAKVEAEHAETRARVWERMQTTQREEQQEKRGRFYENVKAAGIGGLPDLQAFLLGNEFSRFASSNVSALVYDMRSSNLYIRYIGNGSGRWYRYYGIDKNMAIEFFTRASKGIAVWDLLRVRGTKTGHKKRFDRDAPPPTDLPLTDSAAAFGTRGGI